MLDDFLGMKIYTMSEFFYEIQKNMKKIICATEENEIKIYQSIQDIEDNLSFQDKIDLENASIYIFISEEGKRYTFFTDKVKDIGKNYKISLNVEYCHNFVTRLTTKDNGLNWNENKLNLNVIIENNTFERKKSIISIV